MLRLMHVNHVHQRGRGLDSWMQTFTTGRQRRSRRGCHDRERFAKPTAWQNYAGAHLCQQLSRRTVCENGMMPSHGPRRGRTNAQLAGITVTEQTGDHGHWHSGIAGASETG